jgi:hypothetical protein
MHIVDELFDWFGKNAAFGGCEGAMVAGEICYALGALGLLEFAGEVRRGIFRGNAG